MVNIEVQVLSVMQTHFANTNAKIIVDNISTKVKNVGESRLILRISTMWDDKKN